MSHCLYDGVIGETLVKADNLLRILVIIMGQFNEIDHF